MSPGAMLRSSAVLILLGIVTSGLSETWADEGQVDLQLLWTIDRLPGPSKLIYPGRGDVLVQQSHSEIVALDLASGRVLWSRELSGLADVRASKSLDGILVYVQIKKGVSAVRLRDGEALWQRTPRGAPLELICSTEIELILQTGLRKPQSDDGPEVVTAIDPTSGSELWRHSWDQEPHTIRSWTIVGEWAVAEAGGPWLFSRHSGDGRRIVEWQSGASFMIPIGEDRLLVGSEDLGVWSIPECKQLCRIMGGDTMRRFGSDPQVAGGFLLIADPLARDHPWKIFGVDSGREVVTLPIKPRSGGVAWIDGTMCFSIHSTSLRARASRSWVVCAHPIGLGPPGWEWPIPAPKLGLEQICPAFLDCGNSILVSLSRLDGEGTAVGVEVHLLRKSDGAAEGSVVMVTDSRKSDEGVISGSPQVVRCGPYLVLDAAGKLSVLRISAD